MGRARFTTGTARLARVLVPALLLTVALQAGPAGPRSARAATPTSGTVSAATPTISWDFAPVGGPAGDSDAFALTVQLPDTAANFYAPDVRQGSTHAALLQVTMTWTDSSADQTLFLGATNASGSSVGDDTLATTNDGSNINTFQLQDPTNQTYTLTASNAVCCSHAAIPAHAVANLQLIDLANQAQPPNPTSGPGFSNYHIPLSLMPARPEETTVLGGRAFGEPSIGVDPRVGHDQVMYQAGLYTIRATFNDATAPATPTFTDVSFPVSDTVSEDAILDVDRNTGRTFASQLLGACSAGTFSDNDGGSWTPSQTCQIPAGVDHQTIGAGAFHAINGIPV
ncbi:MAG: hypothetical protein E6J45_01095, partial [Chloroflexi bacterium]